MGWVNEADPTHEGYPVALVAVDPDGQGYVRFQELGSPTTAEELLRVHVFQVACECGWRSRRFYAPLTARYSPHSLDLGDAETEEEARGIWLRHCMDAGYHDGLRSRKAARLLPYKAGR